MQRDVTKADSGRAQRIWTDHLKYIASNESVVPCDEGFDFGELLRLIVVVTNERVCYLDDMKATAQIASDNGHTVLPAAVRRFLGVSKGDKVEFESRENGEVIMRPLPTLDALFGSLQGTAKPQADESAQGWNARAERVMRKGAK